MTLRAKKQIRNPCHHFTNVESAHRCLPPNDVRRLSASIGTETKARKNTDHFKTSPGCLRKKPSCCGCRGGTGTDAMGRAGFVRRWRGLGVNNYDLVGSARLYWER